MNDFTEIHGHFIYGVDDGAQTEETMTAMLDAAAQQGVTRMFATSHTTPGMEPFPQETYDRRLENARAYCAQKGYEMTLYSGAELLYNPALEAYAREHSLPVLGDSEWVLLEYLPSISAKELERGLDQIARCGYSILLAHIERYACLEKHGLLEKLRDAYPVMYQVNCSTVLEPGGFWRRRRLDRWLRKGLVDIVASDAHNTSSRPIKIEKAYEQLKQQYGTELADQLTGRSGLWFEPTED